MQGAQEVARQLVSSVKAALFDKPKEAGGDWDILKQQFWAATDSAFFAAMSDIQIIVEEAVKLETNPDTQLIQTRFMMSAAAPRAVVRYVNGHRLM